MLTDDKFIQSVSARGNSYINSPMESFFSLLKRDVGSTFALAKNLDSIFAMFSGYIEVFNNERPQSNLAGLTPNQFYQ